MPKWLSSTLVAIAVIAFIVMALLPKNVTVTVTSTVQNNSTSERSITYNGDVQYNADHHGAVAGGGAGDDAGDGAAEPAEADAPGR